MSADARTWPRAVPPAAAAVGVAGHLAVAALAAAEYVQLGWLVRFDLAAVLFMIATAGAGLLAAARVAWRAWRTARTLRRTLAHRIALPAHVARAATSLGIGARVDLVPGEPFALTHGLRRPRILISTGLIETLTGAELAAVLAHERSHLSSRDPLRMLAVRLLAGYAILLPIAPRLADRVALGRELAADRDAVAHAGRAAVAGALLKLAEAPLPRALAPSPAMGARRGSENSLQDRVAHLEDGRPPRRRLARLALAATSGNLALVGAACMCCIGMAHALSGGAL